MLKEEELFNEITLKLSKENQLVQFGKMISSPGITYKKKFFAFYYKKEKEYSLLKGIDEWTVDNVI